MYLFYTMNNGCIPMGTDGMLKVPSNVLRSTRKLEKLAKTFLNERAGKIYMLPWDSFMSQATPWQFENYVLSHGTVIAQK